VGLAMMLFTRLPILVSLLAATGVGIVVVLATSTTF